MIPSIFKALRACCRYAMALAINSSELVTPGDLAKSIMASALSCWSQGSALASRALMPLMAARMTQGSEVKMSPPLMSCVCVGGEMGGDGKVKEAGGKLVI